MKKHFLKALSLIMAVSLLCSCTSQENTFSLSPAPETSSTQQESSTNETTASSQETSKPETEGTTKSPETESPELQIDPSLPESAEIEIEGVDIISDFPTGTGISAAATVLQFYGVDVDIVELANCAPLSTERNAYVDYVSPSPWEVFLDTPRSNSSSYYAPPVIKMMKDYLEKEGIADRKITDISGCTLSEIYSYVAQGKPVMIWFAGTEKGDEHTWVANNGEKVTVRLPMSVWVIYGYSKEKIMFLLFDSEEELNKQDIYINWESAYFQAVLVE
ncbi:MAG: hypothetical protein E7490_05075 [Ruminococcaceae bacterium]|nr:hypothetical protein [Oscillospiraceae bacterium]